MADAYKFYFCTDATIARLIICYVTGVEPIPCLCDKKSFVDVFVANKCEIIEIPDN